MSNQTDLDTSIDALSNALTTLIGDFQKELTIANAGASAGDGAAMQASISRLNTLVANAQAAVADMPAPTPVTAPAGEPVPVAGDPSASGVADGSQSSSTATGTTVPTDGSVASETDSPKD